MVSLNIRIKGTGGLFDKEWHEYSSDFPIYIRSKPLRNERVADVEQLGLLPRSLKQNLKYLETHFKYVRDPIMLPGVSTAYEELEKRREFMSRII